MDWLMGSNISTIISLAENLWFILINDKTLCEISPRLQQLLLRVTQYNFTTLYVKHDGVPVADCLSQNVQIESALEDESINITVTAISMF